MLRWGHSEDLDLWVYDGEDRSRAVGWELDEPRSLSMAGGVVTLDVDNYGGEEGPETTKLEGVSSGRLEVWVNHYSDVFTQEGVGASPATVEVYCHRCLDEEGVVREGLVASVRQRAADVTEGAAWWKVGEFVAPASGDETARLEWETCTTGCYVAGSEELVVSFKARDIVTQAELTGVEYLIYSDYPADDYMGCVDTACGSLVASVSGSGESEGQVPAPGWYLFVTRLDGYYRGYLEVWVGAMGSEVSFDMVAAMRAEEDRVVLRGVQ